MVPSPATQQQHDVPGGGGGSISVRILGLLPTKSARFWLFSFQNFTYPNEGTGA